VVGGLVTADRPYSLHLYVLLQRVGGWLEKSGKITVRNHYASTAIDEHLGRCKAGQWGWQ
jgi:hypothetical protein